MEKTKIIIQWIISIFFILIFILFEKEAMAPSILLLISGIMLLPPVDEKIKGYLQEENKIKKYKIVRNIFSAIIFFAFLLNVPENKTQNVNTIPETTQNSEEIHEIDQNEINKSVGLSVTEKNGTYTGERIDGKKQGNGKYEWNDGKIYEGEFANDEINGEGKLTIPNQGTYEGKFVNGKKNGEGIYTFANGDIYQGEWKEDKMEGQGTYTFANGDVYVGTFSNNKFNGQGTYTKDGNKYTGNWKDNEYQK